MTLGLGNFLDKRCSMFRGYTDWLSCVEELDEKTDSLLRLTSEDAAGACSALP